MTIEYVASPADVGALYSYCWQHCAYFRRRIILNSVLVGLALIAIPFFADGNVGRNNIFIALGVAVAFPIVVPFIARLRTKKDKRELSISANGVHTQIGKKSGDIPWARIASVFVTDEHIFLLGRNLNGFCIPRSAFRETSERDEFIRLCRDLVSTTETQFLADLRRLITPGRILVVVLFALFVIYGRPIFMLEDMKWRARSMPELWVVPTPLPIVPIGQSSGLELSYYGYKLQVPWTKLLREQKSKSMTFLNFANGPIVVFHDPSQKISELAAMKQGDNEQGFKVRDIYGDKATSSSYAFRSKILYLTPRDLTLFSSRLEMVGNSALLMMKPIHVKMAKGGLYSFQTEWLRGFQNGDPAIDKMTIVDGFDSADREVELWVGATEGSKKPSQADVNRIIYSIRPDNATAPN